MNRGRVWGMGAALVGMLLWGGAAPGDATALAIAPVDYAFSRPTGVGMIGDSEVPYEDPDHTKLTDGVRGGHDWTADPEPWVGWTGIREVPSGDSSAWEAWDLDITFAFGAGAQVRSVVLGANQDARYNWNVVLPARIGLYQNEKLVVERRIPFDLARSGPDNDANNGRRHDLWLTAPEDLTFGSAGSTLTLRLSVLDAFLLATAADPSPAIPWDNATGSSHNGLFWMFLDEVTFHSTPVPEPSSATLLALGGLVAAARCRRRE